jgi:hypothetical protein
MKIKAFSFLEVMVGMVLSGMVISMVYSVYIYSHQHLFKFTHVQSNLRNYYEFSSTLNRDIEQGNEITKINSEEIDIKLNDKSIQYEFTQDYVLRNINSHSDTFFIAVTEVNMNLINELKEKPLIDFLEITINETPLSFYKHYGAIIKIEE